VYNDLQQVALLHGLLDPHAWIDRFGAYALWGVALIVFIECWLFPFLPGDSLLFLLGLLISQQNRVTSPIWLACLVLSVAAVASNVVGYAVGARAGPAIFNRPDGRIFRQSHIDKTFAFFDRYGKRAIFLARFVPIVRTFITLAAGVGRMPVRRFLAYSAIGGVVWATGVTLLGYWLGQVSLLNKHLDLVLVAIVAVSLVPVLVEVLRGRSARRDTRYDEEQERLEVLRRESGESD
jgi:membrane-associated protein